MPILFDFSLGLTIFLALAALAAVWTSREKSAGRRRILALAAQAGRPVEEDRVEPNLVEKLFASFGRVRAQLGFPESAQLRERLEAAGAKTPTATEAYFAARLLLPVAGVLAGGCFPSHPLLWVFALSAVGCLAPGFWLDRAIRRRRERIRKSIPDAIDLLVICVEAGLGLDQAVLRAGEELAVSHPEIHREFLHVNREQHAGCPRLEAWRGMAKRTGLPEVAGFVRMLVETERFGTPIAHALGAFADGLRLERRQLAEEKAAKTSVKIVFPLVLFIFPCLFIVLLGPAFLSLSRGLAGMMH